MCTLKIFFIAVMMSMPVAAFAGPQCVDADGEAVIINDDAPSAKAEAVARAKWAAIEQAVGVDMQAQSVVHNMMLVDEAVNKKINGSITSYKVLSQEKKDDLMVVKVNACIEPKKAKDAVSDLALNNSIAVFIPARKMHRAGGDAFDETNILSESIIGDLAEQGYTVVDVAPTSVLDANNVENALKSGNFSTISSLMYKFLANVLVIGKIEFAQSTRKGEDVGYGVDMPFNQVTARLTYRLLTRDSSGKLLILGAGNEQAKGLANDMDDAAAKSLQNLATRIKPVLLSKVGNHIKATTRNVMVRVSGVKEIGENFAIKEKLQNIAWVTAVEEKGLGEFVISYPENTIYLANSIGQKGGFRITGFTPTTIDVACVPQ